MPTPLTWPLLPATTPTPTTVPATPGPGSSGSTVPTATPTFTGRQESEARLIVEGKPVLYKVISNPLIDDVVIVEARLTAYEIENGPLSDSRRVDRGIRDFLIRLGVER